MSNDYSVTTLDFGTVPDYLYKAPALSDFNRIAGEAGRSNYVDFYKRQRRPTDQNEVDDYKRFAYACANINADIVAESKYKLFVKTKENQRKPLAPTRELSGYSLHVRKSFDKDFDSFCKDAKLVEEVTSHPILDLLEKVNESPFFGSFELRNLTQLYQEITGKAYWYVDKDILGRPSAIWILMSQFVYPKKLAGSKNYIDYFEYNDGKGKIEFGVDEIIWFYMPNLNNIYLDGMSPLEAAWEDNTVSNKMISTESGMLDNEARPDIIVTPNESISPEEARAWERQYLLRFNRARGGGILVMDEKADVKPLNWPPRDLARLEIHTTTKKQICNCYAVPIALVESQSINRATLEAAQVQHGRYAVRPRLARNCSVLNKRFVPLFDPTGRLYLGYDDPVPEDEKIKFDKIKGLVEAGVLERNEARAEYNYPPHKDGSGLLSANEPANYKDGKQAGKETKKETSKE